MNYLVIICYLCWLFNKIKWGNFMKVKKYTFCNGRKIFEKISFKRAFANCQNKFEQLTWKLFEKYPLNAAFSSILTCCIQNHLVNHMITDLIKLNPQTINIQEKKNKSSLDLRFITNVHSNINFLLIILKLRHKLIIFLNKKTLLLH